MQAVSCAADKLMAQAKRVVGVSDRVVEQSPIHATDHLRKAIDLELALRRSPHRCQVYTPTSPLPVDEGTGPH